MQKKQIYSYVEGKGFTSFKGKESQDICFLKESSVATYLEDLLGASAQKGPILTTKGKEIGRHGGLFRYTVGQRRGLGLPDTTPWYVCHLCPEDNSLVVGKHYELFARRVFAISTHWLTDRKPKKGERYLVRLRYSHPGAEALIESIDDNTLQLVFNEPQRAIAPGQFAVLYNDSRVIGSAEISQQQD